jgi:hypothetical protein
MGQSPPEHPTAHKLFAQIRVDIALAWEQVEDGRAILARSTWLVERWRQQALAGEPSLVPEIGRASVAGEFIVVEEEERSPARRRRAPARAKNTVSAQAHHSTA